MVYKAVQAFLSEKASNFLPGKTFFPEEDRYASQFDPSSAGIRPIARPWFNISISIQIGSTSPACTAEHDLPAASYAPRRIQGHEEADLYDACGGRGRQQAHLDRVLGHGYGRSTVQGHGIAHYGDVYNYHYFQARTLQRRASSPGGSVQRSFTVEALSHSTKQENGIHMGQASQKHPSSPGTEQHFPHFARK